MRERINENPMVQAALIGIMVLVFGFILVTRVMGGGSEESGDSTPATAPATAEAVPGEAPATSAETAPADGAAVAPATSDSTAPSAGAESDGSAPTLEAGEGMPAAVVEAYDANKVVVLLVVDSDAIDDKRVEVATKDLEGRSDVALFQTEVQNVADYSQITNGVGINRTPALIVMVPRDVSDVPVASISYGFRSLQSVNQAVEDARYDGKKAPYYPE